jgi:hypothetical protein
MKYLWIVVAALGCAHGLEDETAGGRSDSGAVDDADPTDDALGDTADIDASDIDSSVVDSGTTATDSSVVDTGTTATDTGKVDTAAVDTGSAVDTAPIDTGPTGPITGGPCLSGAKGQTALRVRFYNGGGKPTVSYEVWGLPDKSRQKVGVFGYTIPYSVPPWADGAGLAGAEGGLQLDSSNFIDIELSTKLLSSVSSATLSIYGRSYAVSTSGSFNWQTFKGTGATPSSSMTNVPPYKWNPGDATTAIVANDGGILLRIKAGPASNSLVVNRIELCLEAS